MKIFKITLAAMALFATSFSLQANPPSEAGRLSLCARAIEGKMVVIQLVNLAEQPTFLSLRNTYGDLYYKESIRKHNGHRALLDLNKLPEGRYILSVSQKGMKKTQVIRVSEGQILVSHCQK